MATRKSYADQLKHPNWQRKRLEVLNAANFECEMCGEKEKTLHVHHKRYVKGREVWEYARHELACLCEDCHSEHHELHGLLEEVLAAADHFDPYRSALGLVAGYMLACYSLDKELEDRVRAMVGTQMDTGILALQLACMSRKSICELLRPLNEGVGCDPVLSGLLSRWDSDEASDKRLPE